MKHLLLLWLLLAMPAHAETIRFVTHPERVQVELIAEAPIYLGVSTDPIPLQLPPGDVLMRFRLSYDGYTPRFVDVSSSALRRAHTVPLDGSVLPLSPDRWDTWLAEHGVALALGIALAAAIGIPMGRARRRAQRLAMVLAKRPDPVVGQTRGRWLLVERLGEGGQGAVFRALDAATLDELSAVAVKLVAPERLSREVRAAVKLQHPNLARILDWGQDYIVFDLIDGVTLRSLITPQGMSQAEAWRIMEAILQAVAYAHEQGVVHGDLKPENVMLAHGRPVVLDFGIARLAAEDDAPLGTAGYAAPEGVIDARSDQYSLGVLYAELLGETAHPAALHRMQAQNPADRFGTLTEAQQALSQA